MQQKLAYILFTVYIMTWVCGCNKSTHAVDVIPPDYVLVNNISAQIAYLNNYLSESPNHAEAHYKLAVLYLHQGETDNSYKHIYQAWERKKNNSHYTLLLAKCYLLKGLYLDALDYLAKVNESQVPTQEYINVAAEVYFHNKQTDKAINYLDRVSFDTENKAFIAYKKGLLYEWSKDIPSAIKNYQNALVWDTTYAEPALSMAKIYKDSAETDSILKYYRIALQRNPLLNEVFLNLADVYLKKNLPDSAIYYYTKSIQADSTTAETYFKLSNLYLQEKKYTPAAQTLLSALKFYNDSSTIYYKLGYVYEKQLKPDLALNFYSKVDSSNSNFKFAADKISQFKKKHY